MSRNFHPYSGYTKSAVLLGTLLIALLLVQNFSSKENSENTKGLHFNKTLSTNVVIREFNPNIYTLDDWKKIGFTEKQAATILKYKEIVGGNFTSKEQLKKCYSISESKFKEIEPFLLLPESSKNIEEKHSVKSLKINKAFNPNNFSQSDWENIGFTEKQANSIIKYKNYLGGKFESKENIKNCFVVSESNYSQLKNYLLLPEKSSSEVSTKTQLAKFDPNNLDENGWMRIGFSKNQATSIIKYRDKVLKGSFKSVNDVKACFVISSEKFNEIKPFIQLNVVKLENQETDFASIDLNKISFKQLIEFGFNEKAAGSFIGFRNKLGGFANTKQMMDTYNIDKSLMEKLINTAKFTTDNLVKYSLTEAPEDWLKSHPYFKYSAEKIIFYRASMKTDNEIWKALKLKPEYETRMRWYVK